MRGTTSRTMKIRSSTIYKVCILFLLITSGADTPPPLPFLNKKKGGNAKVSISF